MAQPSADSRSRKEETGGGGVKPGKAALPQPWSYPMLLSFLLGLTLAAAVIPAPLDNIFADEWHSSTLDITIIFAAYWVAVLASIMVSGRISDVIGRKPFCSVRKSPCPWALSLLANDLELPLAARMLHGAIVVVSGLSRPATPPWRAIRALERRRFTIGNAVVVIGCAVLAQYAPHPLSTSSVVVTSLCLLLPSSA